MTVGRHLDWEGCVNVRDLGGLPTTSGRVTRWGAVVRGDSPAGLTPAGWSALRAYGIRTIVDLRNDDERTDPAADGATGLDTVHVPLDDLADSGFWRRIWDEDLDGTPLYYLPFLERKPERCAAAVAAVADARPGGVLVHCTVGRDRSGLVSLLLLALVGVAPDGIAGDYELSDPRLVSLRGRAGAHRAGRGPAASLARRNTSSRAVVLATLEAVDVEARLRAAGLTDRQLGAVRDRLLEPPGPAGGRPRPTATRPRRRSAKSGR